MPFQRFEMLPLGRRAASGDNGPYTTGGGGDEWHAGVFLLNVTAVEGTLPSLDVFVQARLPDDSYADLIAFARVTDVGKRMAIVAFPVPGAFDEGLVADRGLALGSVRTMPMGPHYRLAWVIGGTAAPAFTFSVKADLYGSHLPPGA